MPVLPTLAAATSVLTFSGAGTDTQTITCGGKTYTTQTSLTDVDGNVLLGADRDATITNLKAAINLEAGAGTLYATSMTKNKLVKCTAIDTSAHTLSIAAKVKGTIGNLFATTETQTNASWTSTVMANGSGDFIEALDDIQDYCQINSEVEQAFNNCLNLGTND